MKSLSVGSSGSESFGNSFHGSPVNGSPVYGCRNNGGVGRVNSVSPRRVGIMILYKCLNDKYERIFR